MLSAFRSAQQPIGGSWVAGLLQMMRDAIGIR